MGRLNSADIPGDVNVTVESTEESKGLSGIDTEKFPPESSDESSASESPETETILTEDPSATEDAASDNTGGSDPEEETGISLPENESGSEIIDGESDPLAETESLTQAPQGTSGSSGGFTLSNNMLYGALALVLVLLLFLLIDTFRRNRRQAKATGSGHGEESSSTAPAPEPSSASDPQRVSHIQAAVIQDMGARDDQQDSYGMSDWSDAQSYHQRGTMAVVADGMGGLANGSAVSSLLVRTLLDGFSAMSSYMQPQEILLELALRANIQVNQLLRGSQNGGSTLLSAIVKNGRLHFLTVGDSHIYLYRQGALLQLNREHIYQEELAVKAVNRQVSIPQVTGDRQAHSLTSYFGIGAIPYLDRNDTAIKLIDKDRIILATDGVFGTLSEAQMENALQLPVNEAAEKLGEMIRLADKPYQDNFTAIILEYRE